MGVEEEDSRWPSWERLHSQEHEGRHEGPVADSRRANNAAAGRSDLAWRAELLGLPWLALPGCRRDICDQWGQKDGASGELRRLVR